ncbi:MAG: uL22 family ribosomal protein [Nanoarchaeota archaeon]
MKEKTNNLKIEENKQELGKKELDSGGKTEEKTVEIKKIRTEAIVNGISLHISTKHSMAICDFIRNKDPEASIIYLDQVSKMKKAMPMKGEIPHRRGMKSGRYPVNASLTFIKLLKSLIANASQAGLEKPYVLFEAYANQASKAVRKGGREIAKRTNVVLKLKTKMEKTMEKK